MAVYDRIDKRRRRAIKASKVFKQDFVINWKLGGIPKTELIKMMVEILILDIKVWWCTKRLIRTGYYDQYNDDVFKDGKPK